MKITTTTRQTSEVELKLPYFYKNNIAYIAIYSEDNAISVCEGTSGMPAEIKLGEGEYIYNIFSGVSCVEEITEQEFESKLTEFLNTITGARTSGR